LIDTGIQDLFKLGSVKFQDVNLIMKLVSSIADLDGRHVFGNSLLEDGVQIQDT